MHPNFLYKCLQLYRAHLSGTKNTLLLPSRGDIFLTIAKLQKKKSKGKFKIVLSGSRRVKPKPEVLKILLLGKKYIGGGFNVLGHN